MQICVHALAHVPGKPVPQYVFPVTVALCTADILWSCRFQLASALLLPEHGEPLNVLKLEQQELPQLGADDVKVHILAVSPLHFMHGAVLQSSKCCNAPGSLFPLAAVGPCTPVMKDAALHGRAC